MTNSNWKVIKIGVADLERRIHMSVRRRGDQHCPSSQSNCLIDVLLIVFLRQVNFLDRLSGQFISRALKTEKIETTFWVTEVPFASGRRR